MTNIILYTIDCLRADKVNEKLTPNILKLASKGVRFMNAFTCSGYTTYACSSIMTSMYPPHHGCIMVDGKIRDDVTTLAEVLSSHGYKTYGLVGVDRIIGPMQGLNRGFQEFKFMSNWVNEALKIVEKENNFFLWGHYFDVHNVFNLDAHDFRVREMDENLIGKTIELLGDKLEDTIFIVMPDHGEALGAHGFQGHDSPYDEVMHIPLVIYNSKLKPRVERKLVRNIDIMPTILNLLGITFVGKYNLDGISILPSTPIIQDVYFYNNWATENRGYNIIRNLEWKLIEFFFEDKESRYELYNIKEDPKEEKDLYLKNSEIAEKFKRRILEVEGYYG